MKRRKSPSLRGSVMQNTPTVRMRAKTTTRFGYLLRWTAAVVALLIVLALPVWLWRIGWPQHQLAKGRDGVLHLTQKAQFAVKDITVEGRQQTSKDVLSTALGLTSGSPILGFDIAAAQERIAHLPWVASVIIERHLPDTVRVYLVERTPLARWQHDNHMLVIDTEGKELTDAEPDHFQQLPLLVGAGAPEEAADFFNALKPYPEIDRELAAAVRVGERRWDLHLRPNIVARLPEDGIHDAMKKLSILITGQKVLERNIAVIDLRMPDRLVIEPAGAAATHTGGDARL